MTIDVTDLFEFYQSSLGEVVTSRLGDVFTSFHEKTNAKHLIGLGYTVPYASIDLHLVPEHIGVMQHTSGISSTVMVDDYYLPFQDESVDALVMIHMLEHSQNPRRFLREIWRVMASGGRMLMVVPNRRGMWSRFENNPFGYGQPFSKRQIVGLLRDNMFTCTDVHYALSTFPINHSWITTHLQTLPNLPKVLLHRFSGVIVVEVVKQVCAVQLKTKLRTRLIQKMV